VVLALYIHILAAKSGLISFYIFLAGYGGYLAFARRKAAGFVLIAAIPVIILLALKLMPTFRERMTYVGFSYVMFKQGDKSGNIGDIARLTSYKLAFILIKEHPLTGVGTGDMKQEMDKLYTEKYPGTPEYGRLLPHNQFLTIAIGCGVPAAILFAIWVFMPLARLRRNRQSFFFFMVWLILFLQLMIEPVLEIQFGVFVYLFFLLLQMQELKDGRDIAPTTDPQVA